MIFNPIVSGSGGGSGGGSTPTQKPKITITGTGNTSRAYVTINGTKYTSAATVEVNSGTVITATARYVKLNNTTVAQSSSSSGTANYSHTVTKDCTIAISGSSFNYTINITA